ncbi:MAG: TIM barrel protein [Bacteroidota bacterium]
MTTAWTTDIATDDAARSVRLTLLWGLDGVVLRTVGGARVPNVTEAPLRRRLADEEVPVLAVDPGLFEGDAASRPSWLNDMAALDDVAAFGRRIGCSLVRVGALSHGSPDLEAAAEAFRQVAEQAHRLGIQLAIRNDAETSVASGARLAALLSAIGHASVGADWRPADALAAGEDPASGLAALLDAGYVPSCVGVRDLDGGEEAILGDGDVAWERQLALLASSSFGGPLVVDGLPQPVRPSGLASATTLIRLRRAAAG